MNIPYIRRTVALIICLLITAMFGSSGMALGREDFIYPEQRMSAPSAYDSHKLSLAQSEGYDVVLMVDRSSSLMPHYTERNEACKTLARILTSDCRMAVGYFGAQSNEISDTGGFLSLGMDGWSVLRNVLDDTDVDYTGTSLNGAFDRAAQLFEQNADSGNQRMMFLVTDGENYVSTTADGNGTLDEGATAVLNSQLPSVINKLSDIPVYIIYIGHLGSPANLASRIGAELCTPDDLGRIAMNGDTKNKVINIHDVSELSKVFREIFFSVKNIGYKEFDAGVSGVHEFSVPTIGASRVQIISECSVPFYIEGIYTSGSERVYGPSEVSSGGILVLTLPEDMDKSRVEAGNYQIRYAPAEGSFAEGATVMATVSLNTSFDVGVTFSQDGSDSIISGYPVKADIQLISQDGEVLPGGEKTNIALHIEGSSYMAEPSDNIYSAEGIIFPQAGEINFRVSVDYDGIKYDMFDYVSVTALPEYLQRECEVSVKRKDLGSPVYIATLEDCTFFASDTPDYSASAAYTQLVTASDVIPEPVLTESCMALRLAGFGKHEIDLEYTDIQGARRHTLVRVSATEKFDWGGLLKKMAYYVVLFVQLLAVIGGIVWLMRSLIKKKNQRTTAESSLYIHFRQSCGVSVRLTAAAKSYENGISSEQVLDCFLPTRRSKDLMRHHAVRALSEAAVNIGGRIISLEEYASSMQADVSTRADWQQLLEMQLFINDNNHVFDNRMCIYFPGTVNILAHTVYQQPVRESAWLFRMIFDFITPKRICATNAKQQTEQYSAYTFLPDLGADIRYYGSVSEFRLEITCLDKEDN